MLEWAYEKTKWKFNLREDLILPKINSGSEQKEEENNDIKKRKELL